MAKSKAGKSKTDIIRDYLADKPDATGSQAAEDLKKHGISAQYFYTIKSNLARRQKIGGAKTKTAAKSVRRRRPGAGPQATVEELQAVATFARDFGGLEKLSGAVAALRQFQMLDS